MMKCERKLYRKISCYSLDYESVFIASVQVFVILVVYKKDCRTSIFQYIKGEFSV